MIGLRKIKRKIRSVRNIQKITRAMQMVSAAKLRRIQDRLTALRPYANKMIEMMRDLAQYLAGVEHPLLTIRPPKTVGLLVISADKGLCGSYNSNILRAASRFLESYREKAGADAPVKLFVFGRKASDHFRKIGHAPEVSVTPIPPDMSYARVKEFAGNMINRYERAEIDELYIVYTEYINPLTQRPRIFKFLPIQSEVTAESVPRFPYGYIFEPRPQEIVRKLLPRYVETIMFRTILEALASEHGARMTAMRNATENADEMLKDLTLTFNKARQASITKELLDIVGGAEAMR